MMSNVDLHMQNLYPISFSLNVIHLLLLHHHSRLKLLLLLLLLLHA